MSHSIDVGRRVIQCVKCDRAAAWHGEETARLAGWRSRTIDLGATWTRTWTCSECWIAAPSRLSPARQRLPAFLEQLVVKGDEKAVHAQLELVRHDSETFAIYLDALANLLATRFENKRGRVGQARKRWLAYVESARRTLVPVAPRELMERIKFEAKSSP